MNLTLFAVRYLIIAAQNMEFNKFFTYDSCTFLFTVYRLLKYFDKLEISDTFTIINKRTTQNECGFPVNQYRLK